MRRFILLAAALLISVSSVAQQRQVIDRIVAVVNDRIILESEVNQRLAEVMQGRNDMIFDEQIWYFVLESLIDNFVLLEQARIDSVEVSDAAVDRILNQRINQLVTQVGGERELERALGQSIIEIRDEYREQFREDLMVDQVRQNKLREIQITRPEVEEAFRQIPADSLPLIPESVSLSHISIIPPARPEARHRARMLAESLRDSIVHHNRDMEELARTWSDGPTASRGGGLPMVNTTDLLPEYAAAAAALDPGEISQVVDTQQGFHVIRLNERQGNRISTNHIMVSVQEEELDEDYAINRLTEIRDSIIHHGVDFAIMARRYSDDKGTAPAGGQLTNPQTGERRLPVDELDRSLYDALQSIDEIGGISEPVPYTFGENNTMAYRIVRLNSRTEEHIANLDQDFAMIRNFALQQKSERELVRWIRGLRDEMYVEYRIPVPDIDRLSTPQELLPELVPPTEMESGAL